MFIDAKNYVSSISSSFYRYVLDSSVSFSANGNLAQGPQAKFNELPHKALLTLGKNKSITANQQQDVNDRLIVKE